MSPLFSLSLDALASVVTLIAGLTLALLLACAKRTTRKANFILSLVVIAVVLKTGGLTGIALPAAAPLLYLYTQQLTQPHRRNSWKDLLHFSSLLTVIWMQTWLVSVSFIIYLYLSHRLIINSYRQLQVVMMDRPRFAFRRLDRSLTILGICCIFLLVSDKFYFALAIALMGMAVDILLRPDTDLRLKMLVSDRTNLKEQARRLKETVAAGRLYEDAELSLASLAEKLKIHPRDLSRIINTGLEKNFNDFINEFRIREIIRRMRDPASDRFTIIGIAYQSGFNSKTTFNRVFKEITGKTPTEYKTSLKKDVPFHDMVPRPTLRPLSLFSEATQNRASGKLNSHFMFKNYFKTAWLNLWRDKFFSLIKLSGLALGIACSLLIMLWANDEQSVDAFHKNGAQLYSIFERRYNNGQIGGGYATQGLMPDELKRVFPEVEYATGFGWSGLNTFEANNKIIKENGNYAGQDFFNMFTYPLLEGSAATALQSPVDLAVSKKMAEDFFGSPGQAIGKTIRFNNKRDLQITAVFDNVPANSSLQFDYMVNWQAFMEDNEWVKNWGNNGPGTCILLRKGTDAKAFENKISRFLDNYNKEQTAQVYIRLGIQRYGDVYLRPDLDKNGNVTGARFQYVKLFSIVAIFILLIACINFMNLETARSLKRAKEIGIRKAVGAVRFALIKQFLGEALLIVAIAVFLSLGLVWLALPAFNQVTGKAIHVPFQEPGFWMNLAVLWLITGLISGSYPAIYLSSFKPVRILKGPLKFSSNVVWFRKGLVVFQFILSIIFITGTIVVTKQVNYIQSLNLGYDRENLLYIPLEGDLKTGYAVFKTEALKMPGIKDVTHSTASPTIINNGTTGVSWEGKDPNSKIDIAQVAVGYDFIKTLNMQILQGRDFSRDLATDSANYIINETALNVIGYKNPLGKPLTLWGMTGTIIGVVKDFHFSSLHDQINPLMLRLGENYDGGIALVKTEAGKTKEALASLEKIYKELNPKVPFTYRFSDEEYQKLYKSEQVVNQFARYLAFLAIFISCLGLLGLVIFTAEQRTKEFGIRKVLGAGPVIVFGLLSREFLWLVGVAIVIALPVAWYFSNQWLQDFAYKTDLSWWVFVAAACTALVIALITISFQALKAAFANPVKSLRTE
ncbi:MAG: ABC transporter permease [Nitrospira sp.]